MQLRVIMSNDGSQAWWIVVAALGLVYLYVKSDDDDSAATSSAETPKTEHDKSSAWVMAQMFVEQRLKSPGSAEYGGVFSGDYQDPERQVKDLGGGKYEVHGWVDAQNAFGAKVRNDFRVTLKYVGSEQWLAISGPELSAR